MNVIQTLLDHGGLATWLILISAALLVVIGIERLMTLYFGLSFNTKAALDSIRSQILNRNYTEALQVCNQQAKAPDLSVIKSALLSVENGREAMRSALGGAVLEVTHHCEIRLPFISLIANVSTLLGLLGTITGLIKTFAAIAKVDAATKAQLLGTGISEAMYSTAAGLLVGIAAMIVHTLCTSKADTIINHAQDAGLKVITWVEQSERAKAR